MITTIITSTASLLEHRVELGQRERRVVRQLIATAMLAQNYDKEQAREAMAALGPCEDETGLAPSKGAVLNSPPGWPRRAND
jgi:hypothetical protein